MSKKQKTEFQKMRSIMAKLDNEINKERLASKKYKNKEKKKDA